jgi:hypothetical protein
MRVLELVLENIGPFNEARLDGSARSRLAT